MKTFKCICCGIEIKPILVDYFDKPEEGMWERGVVTKLQMPFGSELDGNVYIIAICDTCIVNKLKENIITVK
jgi:hypothetical protein